ncbi:MAG: adenine deaminase [Bacillota bacterium]|nr:adenine deaminase [Bacillota bacterium]
MSGENSLARLIAAGTGDEKADLVFKNAQVVNVFAGVIHPAEVAIKDGIIVGIGTGYNGLEEVDLQNKYLAPGFIDGHVHIESSMVTPGEFAKAILPKGTTTVVIDPHEIANVCGSRGIRYMLEASEDLPLNIFMMLPSCVPATSLETSGSQLKADDLVEFMNHPRVLGLGELMDVPAVLNRESDMLKKLLLAAEKRVDGHCPGLAEKGLAAYVTAGVRSDHECISAEEARERLLMGMYIMLREGSATKNLVDLLPIITEYNSRRCLFVTDDRHPEDLIESGHIDDLVRKAIKFGIDPIRAFQMATINTAEYFKLAKIGAISCGYQADLVVFSDLNNVQIDEVYHQGQLVSNKNATTFEVKVTSIDTVSNTVNISDLQEDKFKVKATSSKIRVIDLLPHQIVTREGEAELDISNGYYEADPAQDICKLAVVERHHATGNIGIGYVRGFGLQDGAIAVTMAHDSHNLVIVGTSDSDMLIAAEEVQKMGGGIAVVKDKKVLASLSLPIAGLMSDRPIAEVKEKVTNIVTVARNLGVKKDYDPILTLAFLSLPVIPELKLTDKGLVDVLKFKFVSIAK